MKSYIVVCQLAVIGALSFPQSADATLIALQPRQFPGTMCQKRSGTMAITSHGEVYNPATSGNLVVVCPISGDNSGGLLASGTIKYLDQSPSAISCVVRCDSMDGATFTSTTLVSTENDAENHTMSFDIGVSGDHLVAGSCHYRCTIPPKNSGKASYLIGYDGLD